MLSDTERKVLNSALDANGRHLGEVFWRNLQGHAYRELAEEFGIEEDFSRAWSGWTPFFPYW